MYKPVVPAIIPKDYPTLLETVRKLHFAYEIQIDVVDGEFVANCSWPYKPKGSPQDIKHATDAYTLEVDLMVRKPLVAAKSWEAAGADMIVFHVESVSLDALERYIEQSKVSIGVACHGATSMDSFFPYIRVADYVQLMGIREIGAQGQSFDETVLDKVRMVKEAFPEKMISIDGAVNYETIQLLDRAGADRFVSGSAILKAPYAEIAYEELVKLVN